MGRPADGCGLLRKCPGLNRDRASALLPRVHVGSAEGSVSTLTAVRYETLLGSPPALEFGRLGGSPLQLLFTHGFARTAPPVIVTDAERRSRFAADASIDHAVGNMENAGELRAVEDLPVELGAKCFAQGVAPLGVRVIREDS